MTGRNDDQEFIEDDADADVLAAIRELENGGAAPKDDNDEPDAGDLDTSDTEPDGQGGRQPRDPGGRFAPKGKEQDGQPPVNGQRQPAATKDGTDGQQPPAAPADTTGATPPASWSPRAKAAWANLPQEVRAEIGKREGEVAQGLRALADYKDLKPYADRARSAGVTLKAAFDQYAAIDRLCMNDLPAGLVEIARGFGRNPQQMGQLFADLAAKFGTQVTAGNPNPAPAGQQPASEDAVLQQILAPVLKPLMDKLGVLENTHSQRAEADRNAQVQSLASEINRFSADPKNIYYANVEADMQRLFERGMVPLTGNHAKDLQAAYDLACRLHPEINTLLIEQQVTERQNAARAKEQDKAAKARAASRSLGGSKVPGTLYTEPKGNSSGPVDDIEADVRAAYRAHAQA